MFQFQYSSCGYEKQQLHVNIVVECVTCTNKLWPPGTFFMMCLSIFSFSKTARPLSMRMGGGVASKLVRKSGGGFCMSTVVTFKDIVFNSANKYKSMKYSWQKRQAPLRRPSIVDACNKQTNNILKRIYSIGNPARNHAI